MVKEHGDYNVLINNAGFGTFGPLVDLSSEEFFKVWATFAGQVEGDILVTDKFVYAADGASLYMIDRATGAWYAALGHPKRTYDYAYTTAPTFANGNIFITFVDGAWSFREP